METENDYEEYLEYLAWKASNRTQEQYIPLPHPEDDLEGVLTGRTR